MVSVFLVVTDLHHQHKHKTSVELRAALVQLQVAQLRLSLSGGQNVNRSCSQREQVSPTGATPTAQRSKLANDAFEVSQPPTENVLPLVGSAQRLCGNYW